MAKTKPQSAAATARDAAALQPLAIPLSFVTSIALWHDTETEVAGYKIKPATQDLLRAFQDSESVLRVTGPSLRSIPPKLWHSLDRFELVVAAIDEGIQFGVQAFGTDGTQSDIILLHRDGSMAANGGLETFVEPETLKAVWAFSDTLKLKPATRPDADDIVCDPLRRNHTAFLVCATKN